MSRGVNKVILIGHLGADAEYRQSATGTGVTRCNIATSKVWNDDQGQKQERTEWHRVIFFNRLAEIASQYLKKGMQIYIEGELRTSSWEKDGVRRYSTDIIAREMQMLGTRSSDSSSSDSAQAQNQVYGDRSSKTTQQSDQQTSDSSADRSKEKQAGDQLDDLDDDIPF